MRKAFKQAARKQRASTKRPSGPDRLNDPEPLGRIVKRVMKKLTNTMKGKKI